MRTAYFKKSVIRVDILKDADKGYYALSPSWDGDNNLIFWLNPREQHVYNHGWFNVDELKMWAKNDGPIMKGSWQV